MTSTLGINKVVGDADALIALIFEEDVHYNKATEISNKLFSNKVVVIFPNTAIAEAITTLLRKHSNPALADHLANEYGNNKFMVEYVNEEIMMSAADFFSPHTSKKNTFFDAIVAATAKKLKADAIFSFDSWYKKLGFKLVKDLL